MAYLVNVKPDEQDVESSYPNTLRCIVDSFERLAAFEDSGLSPEEVKNTLKAFNISCEEASDSTCPGEHDLCNFDECDGCSHYSENYEDTERDINCWKKYYLQKAAEPVIKEWTQTDDQELKDSKACGHDGECIECPEFLKCNYGRNK